MAEHSSESDPAIHEFPDDDGPVLVRIVSYGCRSCDLPKATGAWPDAWVAIDEAGAHKRENPNHDVFFLGESL